MRKCSIFLCLIGLFLYSGSLEAKTTFLPDWMGDRFSFSEAEFGVNYDDPMCEEVGLYHQASDCPQPKIFDEYCPYDDDWISECYCPSIFAHRCSSPYRGDVRQTDGRTGYANCEDLWVACCNTTCPSGTSRNNPGGCGGHTYNDCGDICYYPYEPCCEPLADENNCEYGTETCSDGCDGIRTCCKSCTPKASETDCEYGTENCSDGCGGTRQCCKGCTPTPSVDITTCEFGTEDCDDGCGGTRQCCKGCSNVCTTGSLTATCTSPQVSSEVSKNECGNACYSCICPSDYKYVCSGTGYAEGSGIACDSKYTACTCATNYKWSAGACIAKTCDDFGYTTNNTSGSCVEKTPYSGLTCYQCTACAATYKYACTGTGYNGGSGTACDNKYEKCTCGDAYKWSEGACVAKTCSDYSLSTQDESGTTKTCSKVDKNGLECYSCTAITCTYTLTEAACKNECKKVGSTSCTKDGKTYYETCGDSTCGDGESCSGGTCVCDTTCADKVSSKPENSSYTTETCTACGNSTIINTGWSCDAGYSKNTAGTACECKLTTTADTCSSQCKNVNNTSCSKDGTVYYSGCGTSKCEAGQVCNNSSCCTPLKDVDVATCTYGVDEACSDNCGGTRKCCKVCSPKIDEKDCAYGTEDCDDGCGGTRKCCKVCSDTCSTGSKDKTCTSPMTKISVGTTECGNICYDCECSDGYAWKDGVCKDNTCTTNNGQNETCPDGSKANKAYTNSAGNPCYHCSTAPQPKPAETCTYTNTKESCASSCKNVGSESCVKNGTTYYKSCGTSKCLGGQSCCNGTCKSFSCTAPSSEYVTSVNGNQDPPAYCHRMGYDYHSVHDMNCDGTTRCYICKKKAADCTSSEYAITCGASIKWCCPNRFVECGYGQYNDTPVLTSNKYSTATGCRRL